MADPIVFHNGYVAFTTSTGSSTYSEVVGNKSASFPASRAELDDATAGDDINATFPGIQSVPLSLRFRQNFASGGIDALAFSRWNSKTMFRAKIRAVDAAASTTNPSYIWNRVYISSITPIPGEHGQILWNQVEVRPASGGTFTRSTST